MIISDETKFAELNAQADQSLQDAGQTASTIDAEKAQKMRDRALYDGGSSDGLLPNDELELSACVAAHPVQPRKADRNPYDGVTVSVKRGGVTLTRELSINTINNGGSYYPATAKVYNFGTTDDPRYGVYASEAKKRFAPLAGLTLQEDNTHFNNTLPVKFKLSKAVAIQTKFGENTFHTNSESGAWIEVVMLPDGKAKTRDITVSC